MFCELSFMGKCAVVTNGFWLMQGIVLLMWMMYDIITG